MYLHPLDKGQGEGDEGRDGDHLHKIRSFLLAKNGRFQNGMGELSTIVNVAATNVLTTHHCGF